MGYILYKDHCNRKSNQQNLGTIRGSNLCTEIVEYSNKDETAVCNLASIALSRFVIDLKKYTSSERLVGSCGAKTRTFDFVKLSEITEQILHNLDRIIDVNYYPVET